MWCSHCRQDAPGLASSMPGKFRCMSCGGMIDTTAQTEHDSRKALSAASFAGISLEADPRPELEPKEIDFENWDLDRELRSLRKWTEAIPAESKVPAQAIIHLAHQPRLAPIETLAAPPARSGWLSWLILLASLTTMVCGGTLLLLGQFQARDDWWQLGTTILGGGQVALILGLVLHLERISSSGRMASEQLASVGQKLANLQAQTDSLSEMHHSAAQGFYAHLADGANPQILLADLKGQLDLLAQQLARRSA